MKQHSFCLIILPALLLTFFSTPELHECKRSGIKGYVYLVSGNQMPSSDREQTPANGIKTTLYVYELINIKDVSREGSSAFYKSVPGSAIKEIQTDDKGYFKAKLKPGIYSLFIKRGDLFYSGVFDEKNNIHPIEVSSGKMTEVVFNANYNAVY